MLGISSAAERIRTAFVERSAARDEVLRSSRDLIRLCSTAIRASHRNEWESARDYLAQADAVAAQINERVSPDPDLRQAGYTQDAMKELVEAHITLALASGSQVPDPETLGVAYPAYLNGLCEAASEMRRRCLDTLRRGDTDEGERLLAAMDESYDLLVTFDFPDAITGGLRRRVDQLRGVLERTRGDLTNSLRQDRLVQALREFETRVDGEREADRTS